MDGSHFVSLISRTSSLLRQEHGNTQFLQQATLQQFYKILGTSANISIIINNAIWHNHLTEETKPPKRAWNKQTIMDWLDSHHLDYSTRDTKAELLDIAFQNAPDKKYVVDEAARIYGVQILR